MNDQTFRPMTPREQVLLAAIDGSGLSFVAAEILRRVRKQGGDINESQASLLASIAEHQGLR